MANPQMDQFVHSLFWKLAPWILVASAIGTFAGLAVKWLERRAIRFGQERKKRRAAQSAAPVAEAKPGQSEAPHCPICNATMVKRTAKRGGRAGSSFWGCLNYPQCRGTRAI